MNQNQLIEHTHLVKKLDTNLQMIKKKLGGSSDIVYRVLEHDKCMIGIVYIDGLVDYKIINDSIIKSLMDYPYIRKEDSNLPYHLFHSIKNYGLATGNVNTNSKLQDVIQGILEGNTIIMVNGFAHALVTNTQGGDKRAVTEPSSQGTVRGPKDSFTESITTNLTLVRRRIKSEELLFEQCKLGTHTKTDIRIAYMRNIANEKVVQDITRKLQEIEIDGVLESGYLEEYLNDNRYSPFPVMYNTERPDTVAGCLLEGRIAIFVDGTPHVLIAPVSFFSFIQSPEDYYQRFDIATALRIVRLVSFFLSILTPALYVAVSTFHHAMIPTPLIISFASQSENVPFPTVVQALILLAALEILFEAGIRLPKVVGSAISIVGALVMGEAAARAGFVSAPMVIIVSVTAIATFAIPSFNLAIVARLLRFFFLLLGASFGFFGILLGLFCLVAHMGHLQSFGYPYLASYAPNVPEDHKDVIFRFPLRKFRTRPSGITQNRRKQ
ncbi:spore germination protein [Paenibacillus sp. 1001270B_150601_E10]|uniref:spore germination protein n=1 Tax=Paenibacillus sp. 1001270B_150601_E10 TaxID=2787079 RepID=UPI001E45E681|nr:spore germination protein [Paenibacillus sp. 1001270B_150601_E10]